MGVSPNVLAGLAAGLHGGNRAYNERAAELEQLRIQRAQEDRQERILARSIARDELAELREQQRDERDLAGTVAQTYAMRPDAMVGAQDVARLQKHGYGAMLGERAAPADMSEFSALSGLLAPGITPQSTTARESFIRPTEQQLAQRTIAQKQMGAFEDAERDRTAEATYRNWLASNPTAPMQARWQKANELGVKWGGASPAEEVEEQRRRDAFQVRLTGMRNQPATTTGRSTEDERLFQSNPWQYFKRRSIETLSRAIPSMAAGGADLATIQAQIDALSTQEANAQLAALQQGQKDDAARKAGAGQRGGQVPPPANAPQQTDSPQSYTAWEATADHMIGLKPGQSATPEQKRRALDLAKQILDDPMSPEFDQLAAAKYLRKHGFAVNFGGQ